VCVLSWVRCHIITSWYPSRLLYPKLYFSRNETRDLNAIELLNKIRKIKGVGQL
jgi:hypothetical protein